MKPYTNPILKIRNTIVDGTFNWDFGSLQQSKVLKAWIKNRALYHEDWQLLEVLLTRAGVPEENLTLKERLAIYQLTD